MKLDKFNGTNVRISPSAIIGKNVKIGDNTIIYDNVEIGDNSIICNDCVIGPRTQSFRTLRSNLLLRSPLLNPPLTVGEDFREKGILF